LIDANQNNTITIRTNSGSGSFILSGTYNVGSSPQSLAVFTNVDGKVDLVSANYSSSTLTFLTNNGSGSFGVASTLAVGSLPFRVTAADINGDGKIDLITANFGGNTLTILTNNGIGGFAVSSSPNVGAQPRGLAVTDVNGDGRPDLISGNYGDNSMTILTNNGTGGLALAGTFTVGNGPIWVLALDINGDSKADLIDANYNTTNLTVLLNTTQFPLRSPVATGTAYLVNGFVVSVQINNGGYGYTNTPLVRFFGGGGSGASGVAVVSNGVVTGITINNTGSGYTNSPIVIIEPPFITNPLLSIAPASFLTFSNLTISNSYQLQQTVFWYWTNVQTSFIATNSNYTQTVAGVVGGGNYRLALSPVPLQAFATPQVVNGFIVGATITSGGSGYVTNPAVNFVGGSGVNASATSQVSSGGVVTNISIISPGIGYTNPPTIQIGQPPAVALLPTVLPGMQLVSTNLSPYDNYQLQFNTNMATGWVNLTNSLFTPTTVTNSQYIVISNANGFYRLQYVP
jgi:hypothetical protein